jgi:putative CocE/NonD family hydrolase
VLVFSTHPLEQDLEVVGPVKAVLYVSTNQRDTDFTAKLVDVFPDGYARNLTDGILRLRYRNSLERPEPVRPGDVYEITLDAGIASNAFLKGHRIRGGDFEQQLPALRSQSQHRRRRRRRNPPGEGQPDRLPRPPASLAPGADGDVM